MSNSHEDSTPTQMGAQSGQAARRAVNKKVELAPLLGPVAAESRRQRGYFIFKRGMGRVFVAFSSSVALNSAGLA